MYATGSGTTITIYSSVILGGAGTNDGNQAGVSVVLESLGELHGREWRGMWTRETGEGTHGRKRRGIRVPQALQKKL